MGDMHTYQEFLFHVLFAGVASLALTASIYLLMRRSNGIAPDINPPVRLRRWTAAFLAAMGVSQLYWLFVRYGPLGGDLFDRTLLCTALDAVLSAPALLCTMLVMLQDRRRPLWPIAVASALIVVYLLLLYILNVRNTVYVALPFLLVFSIFGIVLVRAVRQYDRWLFDNYADLEHKEVWQTFVMLAAFMMGAVAYSFANNYFFFEVLIEVVDMLFIAVLLWRVETMQTLTTSAADGTAGMKGTCDGGTCDESSADSSSVGILLQNHCVGPQLYLNHDMSVTQLAVHIGTNRKYLGRYFAQQGISYNGYINGLRVQHFMRQYKETVADKRDFTLRQLAFDSGFSSYSTFSAAFKQSVGCSVTEWIKSLPR